MGVIVKAQIDQARVWAVEHSGLEEWQLSEPQTVFGYVGKFYSGGCGAFFKDYPDVPSSAWPVLGCGD